MKILRLRFHYASSLRMREFFRTKLKAILLERAFVKSGCLSGEKKDRSKTGFNSIKVMMLPVLVRTIS